MTVTIKRGPDKKLRLFFESTSGFPALHLAQRKYGADNLRHVSAELIEMETSGDDAVVAFIQGSVVGQKAMKSLGLRLPKLLPSGYHIEAVERRGKVLVVAGGDLFGMLAGLADAFLHGELTSRALLYRGGTRTETPAFPLRYYWTWDHSTNWVLDDPGNQVDGCQNYYLKKPEIFLEDYRRLVDHCIEMRFNGIVIWGFLRDAHGGETYAYEVAKYAADRGVAILPGVGTTGYGGIYYEGYHPYNLETYLTRSPRLGNMMKDGQISRREISPYYPKNQAWIKQGVEWLCRNFPIGGVNFENSDLMVDYSSAGKRGRTKIKSGEADYFKDQFFAYKTALEVAHAMAACAWNTYATYSGFGRGEQVTNAGADMGREPYFSRRMPSSAIAQWTLTGMLSKPPIPLREWMDYPRPPSAYKNPRWPKGLRPPTPRSAGFLHQASQWGFARTDLAVSHFAEACLRGHEAGLEGISVLGEVTSRILAWKLNYLAMRHWTYHPESTLEEFALVELAPWLGGENDARIFVETLCLLEEGKLGEEQIKKAKKCAERWQPCNDGRTCNLPAWQMWHELFVWNRLRRRPSIISATNLV